MSRKPTTKAPAPAVENTEVYVTGVVATTQFVPCRQCGNPGSCSAAGKCSKGFK